MKKLIRNILEFIFPERKMKRKLLRVRAKKAHRRKKAMVYAILAILALLTTTQLGLGDNDNLKRGDQKTPAQKADEAIFGRRLLPKSQ